MHLRLTSSSGSHASMPPRLANRKCQESVQGERYLRRAHWSGVNVKLEGKHPTSCLYAVGGTSMPCCQAIGRWEIRVWKEPELLILGQAAAETLGFFHWSVMCSRVRDISPQGAKNMIKRDARGQENHSHHKNNIRKQTCLALDKSYSVIQCISLN